MADCAVKYEAHLALSGGWAFPVPGLRHQAHHIILQDLDRDIQTWLFTKSRARRTSIQLVTASATYEFYAVVQNLTSTIT